MDVDDISECYKCGAQWLGDDYVHICRTSENKVINLTAEQIEERTRWQSLVEQPESMCVNDLNRAVKFLREELYQQKLKTQEQQKLKEGFVMKLIAQEEATKRQEEEAESLQTSAARYLGFADDLREALQNMLGMFDNPVARRLIPGEFAQLARQSGRDALEKTRELEKK